MNIIVCIKQTFDTEARITLTDEGHIDDRSVLFIVNPYDEYAVEEALRLKEKEGGEVTVVTVGDEKAATALRHCLAMGAGHAILVNDPKLKDADSHSYAVVLSKVLKSMDYDLILCGRESIDAAASQVPSRLAELLNLPQINVVSALHIEDGNAQARRDIEGGVEVIDAVLPAVISVQKGINEVRYPSMRLIMRAKKMSVRTLSLEDLSLNSEDVEPLTRIEEYLFPQPRQKGKVLSGEVPEVVSKLIQHLRDEVKVI